MSSPHTSNAVEPDARTVFLSINAYFRINDVMRMTGLSRATLYRRIAARRFPPPTHLGGRACGWRAAELEAWMSDPQGYLSVDQGAAKETSTQ
jgi:predicted DNA-binding transcriptional regulator AlpA